MGREQWPFHLISNSAMIRLFRGIILNGPAVQHPDN